MLAENSQHSSLAKRVREEGAGFLEGSLKEVLLRRVLRRRLVRVSVERGVLRGVLTRGGIIDGA